MLASLAALFLLAAAEAPSPPAAQGQPVTVAPVTAEGPPIVYGVVEGKWHSKTKRVCFNDPVLGSKIPTKRCMKRAEFEQLKAEARDQLNRIQSDVRVQ